MSHISVHYTSMSYNINFKFFDEHFRLVKPWLPFIPVQPHFMLIRTQPWMNMQKASLYETLNSYFQVVIPLWILFSPPRILHLPASPPAPHTYIHISCLTAAFINMSNSSLVKTKFSQLSNSEIFLFLTMQNHELNLIRS